MLLLHLREELSMQVAGHLRVHLGDAQVAFGEHHRHVVKEGLEEGPVARHFAQCLFTIRNDRRLQAGPHAVPPGDHGTRLAPREHPGNRTQVAERGILSEPSRWTRAQRHTLDHVDRRGAAEIVHEARRLHEGAIGLRTLARDERHDLAPACLARLGGTRPQAGQQHRTHRLFQRAQRERADAVLAMDHLALLGHAQAAVHTAARRGFQRPRGLAAATDDRAAAAMEERQPDTQLLRRVDQVHLRALQAPARGGDAAVLAAVGIPQHHHLHVAARGQVGAVDRIGQQVAQDVGTVAEVVDGFEQRRDIQRHLACVVDQPTPARQREHGQYVGAAVRHADDVGPQGIRAVARTRIGEGREHRIQALVAFLVGRRQHRIAAGVRTQQRSAFDRIALFPVTVAQRGRHRACVHAGFLPYVEPREVETERAHPPRQPAHREPAGMDAAVGFQAVQDEIDVLREFVWRRIAFGAIFQRGLQARTHQVVEQPVRLVAMAGSRLLRSLWHQGAVMIEACDDIVRHPDDRARLAEQRRELAQFLEVAREDGASLRVQGCGNRARVDIRIAVHVAADPGTEAQHTGKPGGHLGCGAVDLGDRAFQRFVQYGDDAIEHLDQVEADMLPLVLHARTHRRRIGRLPRRRQRHAEARGVGGQFAGRTRAVQAVDQAGDHQLLLLEQRAAHGLGRVRGEDGLHVDARKPLR